MYAFDTAGNRTQLCDQPSVNWAQAQPDTCWTPTKNGNKPLKNIAAIDIGIPSSNTTDSIWYQGIGEAILEVTYHPGSAVGDGAGRPGRGRGSGDCDGYGHDDRRWQHDSYSQRLADEDGLSADRNADADDASARESDASGADPDCPVDTDARPDTNSPGPDLGGVPDTARSEARGGL